jgi:hypothetical protein
LKIQQQTDCQELSRAEIDRRGENHRIAKLLLSKKKDEERKQQENQVHY